MALCYPNINHIQRILVLLFNRQPTVSNFLRRILCFDLVKTLDNLALGPLAQHGFPLISHQDPFSVHITILELAFVEVTFTEPKGAFAMLESTFIMSDIFLPSLVDKLPKTMDFILFEAAFVDSPVHPGHLPLTFHHSAVHLTLVLFRLEVEGPLATGDIIDEEALILREIFFFYRGL